MIEGEKRIIKEVDVDRGDNPNSMTICDVV